MIRAQLEGNSTPAEDWAFATLLDLSRLLPLDQAATGGIRPLLTDAAESDFAPGNGVVRVSRTALRQVVDLAGTAVEQRTPRRDRHDRVPADANPAVQRGTERTLPMHALAEALARAVTRAEPSGRTVRIAPWPGGKRWAAAVTHDLDVVQGWPLFAGLRWVELLGRGELLRAASAVGSAAASVGRDPVGQGVHAILAAEEAVGIRATWFVLAGTPSLRSWRRGDVTYSLQSPAARRILDAVLARGHEIGLHGSLGSAGAAEPLADERAALARAIGREPVGLRQHFLRFDPGRTPAAAQAAGFSYDSTLGFADRAGFRLGVADILPLWQESPATALDLMEAPLAWMDRTYSKYQRVENANRWVEDAIDLAGICRDSAGLWVGLWHPNVTPALGFPGGLDALRRLLRAVAEGGPYAAPLADIVSWRKARRALRGRPGEDGSVHLTGDVAGKWTFELQIGDGRSSGAHARPVARDG